MNDEVDDFALVPGQPNLYGLLGSQANAPAPHKRMLSSNSELRDRARADAGAWFTGRLEKMGYTLKLRQPWGFMDAVTWDRKDNRLEAAGDPRGTSGLGKVR